MFGRTFTFWRGLVSSAPSEENPPSRQENEERRIWVRYPAQVETVVQPTRCQTQSRLSATIEDISQGGAKLTTEQALAEGSMISLDIPTSNGVESVLACVVRVTAMDAARWEVGCVFSQELTRDELQSMGAAHQEPKDDDQRKWVRYSCPVRAVFHRIDQDESERRAADVLNISANGVGLSVDEEVETGTLLNVELSNPSGDSIQTILACVVHVSPKDAGQWALGCNFIRQLSEEDLLALQ